MTKTPAEPVTGDGIVDVENAEGTGPLVLACEHASHAMPPEYADLGLDPMARLAHIAWDPGALGLARLLAAHFSSPLVAHRWSRLLYDCNRPPSAPSAVPEVSEIYEIPGNKGLSEAARAERVTRFYEPWRETLAGVLDRRERAGMSPMLVTLHTFTRVYRGEPRAVEIGILHDEDTRLADPLIAAGLAAGGYAVRRNEPYGPRDEVTHTLQVHALPRGIPNVMIEVRNDLVSDDAGVARVGRWLVERMEEALAALGTVRA